MVHVSSPPELVINGRFLMQPVTGVQRVARELTRALDHLIAEEGCPIRLRLVCEPEADLDELDLQVTTVERAGAPAGSRFSALRGHVWEQIVLPGCVRGGHLLCLGNTAPLRALHARHPVTVMIHDLSYRQFPWAYRLHYRLGHRFMLPSLLRRAQTILTVSEREKAMLAALRPEARGRIRVAQNGGWRAGDPPGAEAGRRLAGGHPEADHAQGHLVPSHLAPSHLVPSHLASGYLLYVGSLSRRKNIHGVLEVAIRLAREEGLATLIVGGGSDILAPVAGDVPADVAHLVRFTGPVTDLDQLGALYRHAGCLLFPSFYEASPLPPVEAMHFGCPVVVSAIPAMTERCGTAAVYCDPHSVDDMVAAVRQVLREPADLAARGARYAAHWTWRDQASRVLAATIGTQRPEYEPQEAGELQDGELQDGEQEPEEQKDTQQKARWHAASVPAGPAAEGLILSGQQAPSPRNTHGTVSNRMRRLSASERERA